VDFAGDYRQGRPIFRFGHNGTELNQQPDLRRGAGPDCGPRAPQSSFSFPPCRGPLPSTFKWPDALLRSIPSPVNRQFALHCATARSSSSSSRSPAPQVSH
jgi:hypothetical protein